MSTTPTPRTDALGYIPTDIGPVWQLVEHSKQLERELAEAREQLSRLESLSWYSRYGAAIKQRDRLAEALKVIQTVATPPHHERALLAIRDMAINGLAAVKGGES
jgi:hypothetical protein